MITIVTALYSEAKPFIEALGLKKRSEEQQYQHFVSDAVELVITGGGYVPCLRNVSRHFALFPASEDSVIINVGICGASEGFAKTGDMFLIDGIIDTVFDRTFYPDVLYKNDFNRSFINCVSKPATEGTGLFDMESAAFYEAASVHVTIDRLFMFKVVSDILDPSNPADPTELIKPYADRIIEFANSVSSMNHPVSHDIDNDLLSKVEDKFSLTRSLYEKLQRGVFYRILNDQDYVSDILRLLDIELERNDKNYKKQIFEDWFDGFKNDSILKFRPSGRYDLLNPRFTNIYAEKDAVIPDNFKDRRVILIDNYKDIFNRKHQNFDLQKRSPALILANNRGRYVYKGADVCQDFGNKDFYYSSCMMNCLYDCEYCYLAGMYPSGNIVAFTDLDKLINEIDEILKEHPMYLCVSYDTDLLAAEGLFDYVRKIIEAVYDRPDLTVEIRTKSSNIAVLKDMKPCDRVILAWTLSPDVVASGIEHRASDMANRLNALKTCADLGFKTRVCFDPLIYYPDWEKDYTKLVEDVFAAVDPSVVNDVSIGVFRISSDYLKLIRRRRPNAPSVAFPFVSENGVSHYGSISAIMIETIKKKVMEYMPSDKIFVWEEKDE